MEPQEDLDKAIWAASILNKHHWRNVDIWYVEETVINRYMSDGSFGQEKQIAIRGHLSLSSYDWVEAIAIAEYLVKNIG